MLRPVNEPTPMETRVPIPAASSPGTSTRRILAPPIPLASIRITAAMSGEVKMNDTAAKLPAAVTSIRTCGGVSRRLRPIVSAASPAPSAISGASGPSTRPDPIVARPARMTPGRMFGLRRTAGRESIRGDVTSVARQSGDRGRHDEGADRQDRERPPFRRPVLVAQGVGKMRVQLLLDLVDRLQKAPGRQRHDHADDGDQEQQPDEPLARDEGVRLFRPQFRRRRGGGWSRWGSWVHAG